MGLENAFNNIDLYTVWLPKEELSKKMGDQHKPMKDLRDWCAIHHKYEEFTKLLNNARPLKFWNKQGKKYEISPDHLIYFLSMHGFFKQQNKHSKLMDYLHIRNYGVCRDCKIVDKINTSDVRDFILNWINDQGLTKREKDAIIKDVSTKVTSLEDLRIHSFDFSNSTKNSQIFHFLNGSVKVTADSIDWIDPSESKYVLGDKVIPHNITLTPPMFEVTEGGNPFDEGNYYIITTLPNECKLLTVFRKQCDIHWRKYIERNEMLSEREIYENQKCLQSSLFSLGYMFHSYKDVSKPWLPIFMDYRLGNNAKEKHGRNGKSFRASLYTKFGKKVIPIKANRKGAMDYNHLFGSVTPDTDIIVIDECPQDFDFDQLNDETTSGLNVNPKNRDEYFLPYSDSPKLCCITNFVPRNITQSSKGRQLPTVVSDYYHQQTENNNYQETRKISDEFDKNLHDEDYPEEDWNLDANFIMQSVQFYLKAVKERKDKLDPPLENIYRRMKLQKLDTSFIEWADDYFIEGDRLNKYVAKSEIIQDYNSSPYSRKYPIALNAWKGLLRTWAESKPDFEFNPLDMCNEKEARRYRDTLKQEYYYIRNNN